MLASMRRTFIATVTVLAVAVSACAAGDSSVSTVSSATTATTATTDATSTTIECVDNDDAPSTVVYATRPGVDPDQTSLDLHVPDEPSCAAPVVVWVHGGGYRAGDKRNGTRDKVRVFNDAGWILVSTNYRLTPEGREGSAEFPDPFDDVAAALAWVHEHIAEYGGDPSRIALLGHSAGADIVANVAADPTYLERAGVGTDIVRCLGPLDTVGFDDLVVGPDAAFPPTIGVIRGSQERQRVEREFLAMLDAAGVDTVTIDARSLTHEEVNRNIGVADDTVMTEPLMAFLTACFAPAVSR